MDLDPSRRLSLDLITSDLAEPAELTALLAAHVLEPARLLYGMPRPRPDEDDRTTFGNLVDLDGGHTALMRIEEPLDETVARFAPFVRGFMLLCRLFPQIVEPEGIERRSEQQVLEAMAREAGRATLRRLRADVSDAPNVDLLVRRLIDRGLVYRTGRATYDFALPLFRSFIRRRRKLTELTGSVRRSPAARANDRSTADG
jgi:hypothetical protein